MIYPRSQPKVSTPHSTVCLLVSPLSFTPSPTHYMIYPTGVIIVHCVCVSLPLTGRGGADLRGPAEHLLGSATTNQAADAGRPRAHPTTPLLYILALGLQSGQPRVRGPDRSGYTSLTGSSGTDINQL